MTARLDNAIEYERNQNKNKVVSWHHSRRYRYVVEKIVETIDRRQMERPTLLDMGCAQALLFKLLHDRTDLNYIGIDRDELRTSLAIQRYGSFPNFRIIKDYIQNIEVENVDMVVALETLEHVPEKEIFGIMEKIAGLNPVLFLCTVPIEIGPAVLFKNAFSMLSGCRRHKKYTLSETFWATLYQLHRIQPHQGSHKGFDWRWLLHTISLNMTVTEIRKSPLPFLPGAFNTSVFIAAEPHTS